MIRQFTIVPALLAGAAMIISACSADMPDLGDLAGGSGGSGSGSSNSSSQSSTGEFGSLSGKVERVLYSSAYDGEFIWGAFLLEDGSIIDRNVRDGIEFKPVDIKNIKHVPHYSGSRGSDTNVCALTHDADVYCWGTNEYGQVGNGTFDSTAKEEICKTVDFGAGDVRVCYGDYTYNAFKILTEVQSLISLNYGKTYCAQSVGGDAYCWGKNNGFDASGVTMVNTPVPVDASQYQFTEASAKIVKVEYSKWGKDTSCEITDAGKVACQGYNSDEGMLFGKENKAFSDSVNPIEITGIEKAQSFVGDGGLDFYYVCVLRTDDKIQCWGDLLEDGVLTYTP